MRFIFIIHINKKLYENGNLGTLVLSGRVYVTLAALGAIALITLLSYTAFDLSSQHKTGDTATIHDAPASATAGAGIYVVCGLFVNLFVGAFVSFVAAVTCKERQSARKVKRPG